ncbi:peptide ABC transporter substrate-binding protein [Nocardiopsis terrae]|uniref:Peptide/nickel transport system substrate-binding protein n=1 Tax=Nocardiopsis terrae TaxID=372655 RepID=A0ABR9HIS7_9ACTN|nr:ABC transporter family substrate-binding protein [Nocardiopsis terrae]MBE1458932.1 peptide/nickel transport system substrate-binding protein [Nocardiopsis terrae]GHC87192.1 peptide ABC transporter substrate-binding protein [Nocardiopsis terrae]
MRITGKIAKTTAVVTAGALVLSACSANDSGSDGDNASNSAAITLAWDQEYDSYNNTTAGANSSKNAVINHAVTSGFWYFGEDGEVTPNTDLGTYELTSEDPQIVEYSINPDAVWSDGEDIDCADMMLWWAQQTGRYDFSTIGTGGIEDTVMPDCEIGDKDFALEYEVPYADWASNGPSNGNTTLMPAHVVAEQGGLTVEELVQAIRDEDNDALADAAEFFNEGWTVSGSLPDEELIPSSGPYKIAAYDAGQSLTLEPNENWWGEAPTTESIVYRWIAADEQTQALENLEVNIVRPQPSVDLKNQVDALSGVQVEVYDEYIYEHLDFNFDSSPFSDRDLREAFANCVPRQLIVDNLIKPIQPEAETMDVRNISPFDPGYEEAVAASGGDAYAEVDLDRSRELLEEADAVGQEVRLGFIADNPRRAQTAELIKDSCDEAGFDVQMNAEATFFDSDGGLSQNTYDVAMFAWSGSAEVSGWNSTYRSPEECTADGKGNNNGCYSNDELDKLLQDVLQEADTEAQLEIINEIETILWDDLVTIPLFSHPGLAAWSDNLENVQPNPAQTDIVWNMWEWSAQ